LLAFYVLRRGTTLVEGLQVDAARMRANIDLSHGLVFSQPVLLALVASGMNRDEAYHVVQDNAMQAWATGSDFRHLLEADQRTLGVRDQLDDAFSLERAIRNTKLVFEALDGVD
jgi:adenylosuccinate lyase